MRANDLLIIQWEKKILLLLDFIDERKCFFFHFNVGSKLFFTTGDCDHLTKQGESRWLIKFIRKCFGHVKIIQFIMTFQFEVELFFKLFYTFSFTFQLTI